jgi:hypothetical protein
MPQKIVTIDVTPTVLVLPRRGHVNLRAEVMVRNTSLVTVYLGTSDDVTAGTGSPTTAGFPLEPDESTTVANVNEGLWAIVAAGTADINCMYMGVGDA